MKEEMIPNKGEFVKSRAESDAEFNYSVDEKGTITAELTEYQLKMLKKEMETALVEKDIIGMEKKCDNSQFLNDAQSLFSSFTEKINTWSEVETEDQKYHDLGEMNDQLAEFRKKLDAQLDNVYDKDNNIPETVDNRYLDSVAESLRSITQYFEVRFGVLGARKGDKDVLLGKISRASEALEYHVAKLEKFGLQL